MKQASKKLGLLSNQKAVKILAESENPMDRKQLSFAFELSYHKCLMVYKKGRYLFVEKMSDRIETTVCVSRKRVLINGKQK